MTESLLQELARYVRFDAADQRRLRELYPLARPYFPAIADEFYKRILEHEAAAAVLHDREQIERLKITLCHWLEGLLDGPWDDRYLEVHEMRPIGSATSWSAWLTSSKTS